MPVVSSFSCKLSLPNDNILIVPSRNVLLTRASWELESEELSMTQKERDRLVALRKAQKGPITQRQAATELSMSERPIGRLLRLVKKNAGTKR
jgi:hypothetical protein